MAGSMTKSRSGAVENLSERHCRSAPRILGIWAIVAVSVRWWRAW